MFKGGHWCASLSGKPHYSVGDAFSACLRNVDVVALIMVKGGAEVPGVDGVGSPCASERKFFVHNKIWILAAPSALR